MPPKARGTSRRGRLPKSAAAKSEAGQDNGEGSSSITQASPAASAQIETTDTPTTQPPDQQETAVNPESTTQEQDSMDADPESAGKELQDITMAENFESENAGSSSQATPQVVKPARGAATARGGAAGKMKYMPKTVTRRAQSERDALDKEVQQKEAERKAESERAGKAEERRLRMSQGHVSRGRGRGRGAPSRGMFGSGMGRGLPEGASGPFAGPSADFKSSSLGFGETRGGRAGATGSTGSGGGGGEGGSSGGGDGGSGRGQQNGEYGGLHISVEDNTGQEGGRRQNIDDFGNQGYLDDDIQIISSRRLLPIRLERHEHVPRVQGVNTEASSAKAAQIRAEGLTSDEVKKEEPDSPDTAQHRQPKSKGKDKSKEVEIVGHEHRWKGVYPDEDSAAKGTQIKEEPGEDVEIGGMAEGTSAPQDSADPKTHQADKTTRPAADTVKGEEPLEGENQPPGAMLPPTTSKRTPRQLDKGRPTFLHTDEDKAEWERYQYSRRVLVEELGQAVKPQTGESTQAPEDEVTDLRRDKVYLLQLPPSIPCLVDAKGKQRATDTENSGQNSGEAIDVDNDSEFEGYIGTLTIYEDGATKMNWGGVDHEMSLGCGGELLQEVVLADIVDDKGKAKAGQGNEGKDTVGEAIAMGKLSGKFVVTPDWESLFEKA